MERALISLSKQPGPWKLQLHLRQIIFLIQLISKNNILTCQRDVVELQFSVLQGPSGVVGEMFVLTCIDVSFGDHRSDIN